MSSSELSDRVQSIEESATLALNAQVKQMAAEGKLIYNLSVGELAIETPKFIQDYIAGKLDQNKYTPPAGLMELREKIAVHCQNFYELGWIKPENVIVTASAKPALWACFYTLLNPDDEIIIPIPAWVSHIDLAKIVGAKVVTTQLDENNDINVDDIASKITPKTRAILLNSPQNPTGGILSENNLRALAEIVNQKNITVIADDIYSKLVYTDNFTAVPKCGFNKIVIISGFSKSQAITGWRVGYLIADLQIAQSVNKLLSHVTGNAPVLSQYAAIAAMENDDKQVDYDHLKANWQLVCQELANIENISLVKPLGAFYAFFNVSKMNENSLTWCEQILEKTGVAVVPGEVFHAPGWVRMSFVGDSEKLRTALGLIKEFSENYHA